MVSRRTVNAGLAGFGIASLGTGLWSMRAEGEGVAGPVVKTSAGPVRGEMHGEICRFIGIPYGAPTSGTGRFKPPHPAPAWSAVRDSVTYGDSCPQVSLGVSPFVNQHGGNAKPPEPNPLQKQLATFFSRRNPEPRQSEDCLVLNVWTPAADAAKRPVMVWLHGGGFAVGSGSSPSYEGEHLAKRGDVVVVTINHRLSVFGYLYLGDLAGPEFAQSGNVGMLDIVLALQWVRDNIAAFGGDPHNVTIFGESGGAGKVSVMCGLPSAKGLFHKAIMQSGPCLQIATKERGTAIARQLLKELGIPESRAAELQNVDAMKLAAAANKADSIVVPRVLGFGPMGLIPLIDDSVIFHHPFDTEAAPESAQVPFLVGSTRDEGVLFAAPLPDWGQMSEADVISRVRPMAGEHSEAALKLYKALHPDDDLSYLLADITTDFWMRQAAWRVAELKAKQKAAPAYVYVLNWRVNPLLRCPHGTDVFLSFNTIETSAAVANAPNAQAVADQMSDAWIAFARTGNPTWRKATPWPAYAADSRANLLFDVDSHIVKDYDPRARKFWGGI
jgi:para-nitrobenzyl esterase